MAFRILNTTSPLGRTLFRTLKELFESFASPHTQASSAAQRAHSVQLATAVLLVEVVRADAAMDDAERATMVRALRERFALSDDEVNRLVKLAVDTARTAYDYQRFTGHLNDHFTQPQKIALVEAMWQVAYADGHLDENEMHAINKVAGLLHVTHGEYIAAKMRAKHASPP